jgi:hypothetical protein
MNNLAYLIKRFLEEEIGEELTSEIDLTNGYERLSWTKGKTDVWFTDNNPTASRYTELVNTLTISQYEIYYEISRSDLSTYTINLGTLEQFREAYSVGNPY